MTKPQQIPFERLPDGRYRIVDMFPWAFQGDYPQDIRTFDDVDTAMLTEGDAQPFYVMLPVGLRDSKSGNGIFYDEAFALALMQQVTAKRPPGNMGHTPDDKRDTEYRVGEMDWVGVKLVQEYVWGKAYIPPGEVRDFTRRRRALKAQMATSIYGTTSELIWDDAVEAFRIPNPAENFELEKIDFAPPERAGVQALRAVPIVTAEMAGATEPDEQPVAETGTESEDDMDKLEVIKAMTADDAPLLPPVVREVILAEHPHVRLVAEMREALGLEDNGDSLAAIKALVAERDEDRKTAVEAKIAELAETKVKVSEKARALVVETVQGTKPKTVKDVEAAFDEVLARETIKASLEAFVVQEMGPNYQSGGEDTDGEGDTQPFIIYPEAEAA